MFRIKTLVMSQFVSMALALSCSIAAPSDYLSPLALTPSKDGKLLFVVEKTAKQIAIFDIAGNKVVKTIPVDGEPNGIALTSDEKLIYTTMDDPRGKIHVIDIAAGKVIKSLQAGHTPMSPVLSQDGKTLFVLNRFNNNVSVIDLETGKSKGLIPVTREPVASVLSKDGNLLFVANHLPTGAANVDHMTSVIDVIDIPSMKVVQAIQLPNGAIDLRGICLSSEGKYVFVPSILARFLVPTTQIERGWINTHAMNIIDVEKKELLHTVLLDDVDLGAANPWGIVCSPDGKYICVAHSATHEISLIDQVALLDKLSKIPLRDPTKEKKMDYEASSRNPANDLSFLTGIRRRIRLQGVGPRGLAIVGNRVFAAEYFSDSLASVSLDLANPDVKTVPLGPVKALDIVRQGELYFNDAGLCFQQWQSCSTCHPDCRTDAVNWDLLNDGIGNPKSTKSLLNAHKTPPAMITGIREKAEIAVRAGIRFIQFAVPTEDKATAIDEYLKSLQPIESPHLENGKLSAQAKRGEKIFKQAECTSCHSGPLHTDLLKHNVGTADGMEKDREFDTPSLVETWRTAPFLYDGRAATMEDVFKKFNKNDEHGITSKLSDKDISDLVEYVMSL